MSQRSRLEKQRTKYRQAVSHMEQLTVTLNTPLGTLLEINEYYSGYITTEGAYLVLSGKVVTKKVETVIEGYKCVHVRPLTLKEQSTVMSESWSRSKASREVWEGLEEIHLHYSGG